MRRIHLPRLATGEIELPAAQAHHLRDVLRLEVGASIEAFDDAGMIGRGQLIRVGPAGVTVRIERIEHLPGPGTHLTIAAAVPKGNRADWMIEKLSEIGADVYVPLICARGVVLPQGAGKYDRWRRLASESAKQCGRSGVMRIEPLTKIRAILDRVAAGEIRGWYLSTREDARPILELIGAIPPALAVLVGPEGGWTGAEIAAFDAGGMAGVRLTRTVLRVETAAVAAAAIVASGLTLGAAAATIGANADRKAL